MALPSSTSSEIPLFWKVYTNSQRQSNVCEIYFLVFGLCVLRRMFFISLSTDISFFLDLSLGSFTIRFSLVSYFSYFVPGSDEQISLINPCSLPSLSSISPFTGMPRVTLSLSVSSPLVQILNKYFS
jgi:hypothetical protein